MLELVNIGLTYISGHGVVVLIGSIVLLVSCWIIPFKDFEISL